MFSNVCTLECDSHQGRHAALTNTFHMVVPFISSWQTEPMLYKPLCDCVKMALLHNCQVAQSATNDRIIASYTSVLHYSMSSVCMQ